MTLTREEVIELVGRLDDLKLAEIIASGATAAQITEAKTMVAGGDTLTSLLRRPVEPAVQRVYDVLKSEDPEWEE